MAPLAGCGADDADEPIACTAEVRPSVSLTVVDPANAPLTGVTVTYRVNGGTSQFQACGPAACAIGQEVDGAFSISAGKDGYAPASAVVTVTRDACHVNTQTLVLRLTPTI